MEPRQRSRRGGRYADFFTPGRITILLLAALTLIFIFENTRETEIRLLIPEVSMPLWFALFGTALIGFVCGMSLGRRRR